MKSAILIVNNPWKTRLPSSVPLLPVLVVGGEGVDLRVLDLQLSANLHKKMLIYFFLTSEVKDITKK